ncbi:MAG: hypothetical protein AAGK79_18420 [Pseudomonadota bacterium]
MSDAPAVAVLDPNTKLGLARGRPLRAVELDTCKWPLGCPERLIGKRMNDLLPGDHIVGFAQNLSPRWPARGVRAQISIVLAEPTAIHGAYQTRVARNARRFHRVLSYNAELLARIPNGIFFPYGSTWVRDWQTRDMTKSKLCSLIASAKRSQPGHVLRHQVAEWIGVAGVEVDLLGQGYAPFKDKGDGLAPYRYSVVIENVREENCFTEKLIDTLLCDTVPIYWGCPNIADFIDTRGMMICTDLEDVQAALNAMSEEDYIARLPDLMAAKTQAGHYADFFERAARAVLEDRPVPHLT